MKWSKTRNYPLVLLCRFYIDFFLVQAKCLFFRHILFQRYPGISMRAILHSLLRSIWQQQVVCRWAALYSRSESRREPQAIRRPRWHWYSSPAIGLLQKTWSVVSWWVWVHGELIQYSLLLFNACFQSCQILERFRIHQISSNLCATGPFFYLCTYQGNVLQIHCIDKNM